MLFDPSTKKKKKKGKRKTRSDKVNSSQDTKLETCYNSNSYSYDEMLERLYGQMSTRMTYSKTKLYDQIKIPPVQAYRVGSFKTMWVNFHLFCSAVNRDQSHVSMYFQQEFGTSLSIDAEGRLILRGKFKPEDFNNVLKNYIQDYVKCNSCGSKDTSILKNNKLLFVKCNSSMCGSKRTAHKIGDRYIHVTHRKK